MSKAQARAQLLRQPGGSICSTVHIHNLHNLTPETLRSALYAGYSRTGILIVGDHQWQAKKTLAENKALRALGIRAKKVARASGTAWLWIVQRVQRRPIPVCQ